MSLMAKDRESGSMESTIDLKIVGIQLSNNDKNHGKIALYNKGENKWMSVVSSKNEEVSNHGT